MGTLINATTYPSIYAIGQTMGHIPESYVVAQNDYPTHQINRIEQTLKESSPEKIAAFIYAVNMGAEYQEFSFTQLPNTLENVEVFNYLTGDLY